MLNATSLEWWAANASQHVPCRLPCCGQIRHLPRPVTDDFECSTCGESYPLSRGPASRDYVPSANLAWAGASCKKSQQLKASAASELLTVEDLVATISAPHAARLHLRQACLSTQARPGPGNAFLVWRAHPTGCTVRSGTIMLPERSVLLMAGRGVHFHDITFKGGVVMCAGPHYSGSFTDCRFRSTALYAVHAATVTLRDCITDATNPGLTISGGATHATLSDCVFHDCHTSVIVDAGAGLRARECSMLSTACAVTVNGRGSSAVLDGCAVTGAFEGSIGKTGVGCAGGTALLRDCLLTALYTAVAARCGTTTIEAHGLEVSNTARGVVCTAGARAHMRDCNVLLSRKDPVTVALLASGAVGNAPADAGAARMQVARCNIHASVDIAHAMVVDDGSAVAASLSVFKTSEEAVVVGCNRGGGFAALAHCTVTSPATGLQVTGSAARVRLEGGCVEGGTTACLASKGAKLTASDCELRGRGVIRATGVVAITEGAHAWLHACDVHTGVVGVCVVGGTVVATDTDVHDIVLLLKLSDDAGGCCHVPGAYKGGSGYACSDGWVTAHGGSVRGCAVGLEAENRNSDSGAVTLFDVKFIDCGTGVDVEHQIVAEVAQCDFQGLRVAGRGSPALREAVRNLFCCSSDAGVSLRSIQGTVEHCTFEGFSAGILAASEHEATVSDCSVMVTKHGGVAAMVRGKVALEDCSFAGTRGMSVDEMHTFGVHAVTGGAAAIRRCRFDGLSGDAVEAEGRCTVTIVDSTVTGGTMRGLVVTGDAEVSAQDCRVSDVDTAVGVNECGGKFTGKRLTLQSRSINVHLPSVREQDARRAVVKLVDSVLTGGATSVCIADARAELAFVRCEVSDCDTGFVLGGPVNARIKGTRIARTKTGVSVGEVMVVDPYPCPVCGVHGRRGYQLAYQALLGEGGRPAREGRCVHEGAIARLSMADTELLDCRQIGVRVNLHGRLDAAGVTVRRSRTAFFNEYMNDRATFVRCKAVGCEIPAKGAQQQAVGGTMLPVHVPLPGIEVVPASGDGG